MDVQNKVEYLVTRYLVYERKCKKRKKSIYFIIARKQNKWIIGLDYLKFSCKTRNVSLAYYDAD